MKKNIKEHLETFSVKKALSYIEKDPEKNISKLLEWVIKYDIGNGVTSQAKVVQKALTDKDNNWYNLIVNLFNNVDHSVIEKIFETFVVNASMLGSPRQAQVREKYDCPCPWAILMDPTSACNLRCTGCWAADYEKNCNLTFEELDDIINQGTKMGTYFYIFSGGEPLVRKNDIIKLCRKHQDCAFLAFTNGTLIDEKFAEDMLEVKNFIPAISVEGFEEATDSRRGKGTYAKLTHGMEILRKHKLLFGISCCYTKLNTNVIGSDEYIDDMISKGAMFGWFFTYMPIGVDAVPDLMVTADQRKLMYDKIRGWRNTKSIFTMDFWNDGEYVNGCIAGGRHYLHINANGDIEPCAFIHYSDSNIRTHTLLEAYQRPMFMQFHRSHPFSTNCLRPCPLLDNYGALAKMVDSSGAHSTDMAHPEDVHNLCDKCKYAAENWKPVADEIWGDRVYSGNIRP